MFKYLENLNPNTSTTLGKSDQVAPLLGLVINILLGAVFSICIISMAYAGIMYVLSRGDKAEVHKAYSTFIWSAIAAAMTLGAVAIKNIIFNTIGVSGPTVSNTLPNF